MVELERGKGGGREKQMIGWIEKPHPNLNVP